MPFKSEKQRKWMWANDPEMAEKWEKEEDEKNEGNIMRITRRQLKRIIKEQISATPTGRVEVEWDFFLDGDEEGWNDMSYEEQEAEAGLPPVIDIPSHVMTEFHENVRDYGESQAEQLITDWLSDDSGWLHQGWSWV